MSAPSISNLPPPEAYDNNKFAYASSIPFLLLPEVHTIASNISTYESGGSSPLLISNSKVQSARELFNMSFDAVFSSLLLNTSSLLPEHSETSIPLETVLQLL